jgi:hypothetical protein
VKVQVSKWNWDVGMRSGVYGADLLLRGVFMYYAAGVFAIPTHVNFLGANNVRFLLFVAGLGKVGQIVADF